MRMESVCERESEAVIGSVVGMYVDMCIGYCPWTIFISKV